MYVYIRGQQALNFRVNAGSVVVFMSCDGEQKVGSPV